MTSVNHEPSARRSSRIWAIVPAAGKGLRLGASRPKQYLKLCQQTVLEHTLSRLLQVKGIEAIVVAISQDDDYWHKLAISRHEKISTVVGGNERCESVLNGLLAYQDIASAKDWVLVHDAVRPCFSIRHVESLIDKIASHEVGGILAVPVVDTLKQVDTSNQIEVTVDRAALWQAQTPQIFRYALLRQALQKASSSGFQVTDEASAIENAGLRPLVLEGHRNNLKITRPEDLALAEFYLASQSL